MAIKLSKPGKMPCKSWSLQAIETCPGSRGNDGELVPACAGCYATQGNYRFKNVKQVRADNAQDWRRANWSDDMIEALKNESYFRWFDSGDMYHIDLAAKILEIMRACKNTQFWLPTRMHKFPKFKKVISAMERLPNVVVRKSSDSIHGETVKGKTTSTIYNSAAQDPPAGAVVCGAYWRDGKCADCRACWDKSIPVIAYPQHGQSMARVNAQIIARA